MRHLCPNVTISFAALILRSAEENFTCKASTAPESAYFKFTVRNGANAMDGRKTNGLCLPRYEEHDNSMDVLDPRFMLLATER